MNVIKNFAELSFEEQMKFAESIVKTINSESTFTSDTDFTISGIEVDEFAGGLIIMLNHDDLIEVSRDATWQCYDEDVVDSDPGDAANYSNYLFEDVKKAFKTLETTIEGYKVSLSVNDADEEETIEVHVDDYSHEDSGIGSYEYGSIRGYDSHPYIEAEGTIVKACSCALSFYIEPANEPVVEPETEEV